MSVLFETSLGDIVIDLEVEACPRTCENFLKLCKVYYYNLNAFFNVSKDFIAQAGDPTATGTGGESAASYIASTTGLPESDRPPRYFMPELLPRLKHKHKGTVSMAVAPAPDGRTLGGCGSQFFITLADNIEYLDGKHAVFGHVVEGFHTLDKLSGVYVDHEGRPLQDVRVRHVIILDDPFPDPENLIIPPSSPTRPPDIDFDHVRIADDENPLEELPEEEAERIRREKAAKASALTLEMVGDLPFANVRPPENVLFVCKLNSVTRDEDLELIFSRFGKIMSCQVIRDKKTGDSLQYAFIEFDRREDAEQAYFKMQNVLVDDRRIWVDFSQSVARIGGTWADASLRVGGTGGRGMRGRARDSGFAGRDDLQRASRYRDADSPRGHQRDYDMVFDTGDNGKSRSKHSSSRRSPSARSRSPPRRNRHRERDHDNYGEKGKGRRWDRGERRRSHSRGYDEQGRR